jgi:hypothetical protein
LAADDKPAPKFPVGKETTYVTGPLDKEGYIHYEAALNDRLGKGVTPEKNANVLLWKAFGPTPEGGAGMPAEFFKRLGAEEPPKGGAYLIGLHAYLKDHLKLDPGEFDTIDNQQSQAAQRPWAAKDYPHIAAWLKANEKALAVAVEATKRPDYFNPLVSHRTEKGPGGLLGALLPGLTRAAATGTGMRAKIVVLDPGVDSTTSVPPSKADLAPKHQLGQEQRHNTSNCKDLQKIVRPRALSQDQRGVQ